MLYHAGLPLCRPGGRRTSTWRLAHQYVEAAHQYVEAAHQYVEAAHQYVAHVDTSWTCT